MKNVYQVTFEVQCKVYIFILSYAEYSLPREMEKKFTTNFSIQLFINSIIILRIISMILVPSFIKMNHNM